MCIIEHYNLLLYLTINKYITEDELPAIEDVGEVISSDTAIREKLRPKLLSFRENRRPPYWGTWRKKSDFIKPRNPFGRDEVLFVCI